MKIALGSRPAERLRSAAPLVVAAVLGLAGAAMADGFKISEKLTATPAAPGARGRAVVVVQDAADLLGETADVLVTNVIQTASGLLAFGRTVEEHGP